MIRLGPGKALHVTIFRRHYTIPIWYLTIFISITVLSLYGLYTVYFPNLYSPFRVEIKDLLPPPPVPPNPTQFPIPLSPKKDNMRVPNSVHYVYGLKPIPTGEKAEELPYFAYLAMRSALINIKPEKIYFHYEHTPTGPWWDEIRPHLTLIKTEVPDSILGRKLDHFAHKADVIRLMTMKYTGGVYLDIDMFVAKSFDDLMYQPVTLGMQMSPHSEATDLEPQGLCNAVIIAEPHSSFIDRWINSYADFQESEWDHHSVEVPWELARTYPHELQVLNNRAFFWPMWHGEEIQKVHELNEHDFKGSKQYAYHAWESLAMQYLGNLSPASIRETDTSFHRLVRPFIGPNDDQIYKAWKGLS